MLTLQKFSSTIRSLATVGAGTTTRSLPVSLLKAVDKHNFLIIIKEAVVTWEGY